MKYGLIKFGINNSVDEKRGSKVPYNIGDNIQMIALERIYVEELGVPKDEIVYIDFHELSTYNGEYVVLPINLFFFGCSDARKKWFPASPKIIPVFIGVHFASSLFTEAQISYLKEFAPIGCRDSYTLNNLRKNGIPAYLFGCITATLSLRSELKAEERKTVFIVDVPDGVTENIPKELLSSCEYVRHEHYDFSSSKHYSEQDTAAAELLKKYADKACLVVTSRLHCASPCIAMGIPVILVAKERNYRFSWIEKYVPIYTPDKFSEIDWYPKPAVCESFKEKLITLAANRIKEAVNKWELICNISEAYERSVIGEYANSFDLSLKKIGAFFADGQHTEYVIWGMTCFAEELYNYLNVAYPEVKLSCVIDEFNEGVLHGIKSIHSENYHGNSIIIVTSSAATEYVREKHKLHPEWGTVVFYDGSELVEQ